MSGNPNVQRQPSGSIAYSSIDGEECHTFRGHGLDGRLWARYYLHCRSTAVLLDFGKCCKIRVAFGRWCDVYGAACEHSRELGGHVRKQSTAWLGGRMLTILQDRDDRPVHLHHQGARAIPLSSARRQQRSCTATTRPSLPSAKPTKVLGDVLQVSVLRLTIDKHSRCIS